MSRKEKEQTVLVQITFPVTWHTVDFVSGEFPPPEELRRDSELFVSECFLSEDGRDTQRQAVQTTP